MAQTSVSVVVMVLGTVSCRVVCWSDVATNYWEHFNLGDVCLALWRLWWIYTQISFLAWITTCY